jgi:23S rRNA (guanosine2251-2'-O)-methyltransferase
MYSLLKVKTSEWCCGNMAETIEGRNPLIEALKAGRPLRKIMVDRTTIKQGVIADILQRARERGIPVEYVDRQLLARQSVTGRSQGVIGYSAAREYIGLSELLEASLGKKENPLFCVLDGIEDPHNLGAIVRTAEATGVQGVIIRSRRAAGLTPAVARASAGAIEYVPVARVVNIPRALEQLKKQGIWVTGIDMGGTAPYHAVDFRLPSAIVIGSEGKGLSALVRKRCDYLAYIPMRGKITSLNASIAAGIVMYEVMRQRGNLDEGIVKSSL